MARSIAVFTKDLYLYQKIRLDAPDGVEVTLGNGKPDSLRIFDIDTEITTLPPDAVTVSRTDANADITLPLPLGKIAELLSDEDTPALTLLGEARCALLRGESIKLTEVEYSLLSLLIGKGGEYATRDEILESVWEKGADAGVINVYIHYLREKLEKHGEKIIISSRKCGYKIDEKYFVGGSDAKNN